jgi:hypothetical protein
MRRPVDASRVEAFLREFGRESRRAARVYLVGGATAVLHGWRATTADIDLKVVGDDDVGPVLARLKERLHINIEFASPDQFIPPLPGWEERSPFIERIGLVDFYHFDLYSQALAKIERGFARDVADVGEMLDRGKIEPARLLELFEAIRPALPRYPAVDPVRFEAAVRGLVAARSGE